MSDTDESTSSQIVVGVGLVVVGLLGVIAGLAAAGRQRRVAALRRGRSAVSWRPPTHRSAKTPARP